MLFNHTRLKSYLHHSLFALLSSLPITLIAIPVLAAENVVLSYGLLELSISVDSLATFANEGQVKGDLAFYVDGLTPEELANVQEILLTKVDLSHVQLSQFLYSSLGEVLLQYVGELIQTDSRINGFYALRSAAVLAAADPEGLTIVNLLRQFPTETVRLNGVRAFQVVGAFAQLLEQTEQRVARIEQQATVEAATAAMPDFAQLPDLQQPGPFHWQMEPLTLEDRSRHRSFEADLYYPTPPTETPLPVIVISHGLGADRTSFIDLAQHLASYGFAVAALEHPGSDLEQLQNLIQGTIHEVVAPSEFSDRPKDVSFLLDELQRRNQERSTQEPRFNLEQVGMIGHSFGGYTALALAGATLNFEQLRADCRFERNDLNLVNLSLLLQCIALGEENEAPLSLQDSRIKAVFVMNPISSSLFGSSGLQSVNIPVMIVAGNRDSIAPALLEQIIPFTWLTGVDKYLVLIQGGGHLYAGADGLGEETLSILNELTSPEPALARQYLKANSLAFMQTYVAAQSAYQVYLTARYTQSMSQASLPVALIHTLSP